MRIISIIQAGDADSDEDVYRTSSVRDVISATVFLGLILVSVCFYIKLVVIHPEPDTMAGQVIVHLAFLWFVFWFGIMLMLAASRANACRLPSNWLLRASSRRLLIKFRSFQNHYYPDTDEVVIELLWSDIAWVRKTRETNHRGQGEDAMTEFLTYLDIKLQLDNEQLATLSRMLKAEKDRQPPSSPVSSLRRDLFQARKNKLPRHEIERIKSRIKLMRLHKHDLPKGGVKYHDVPVRLLDNAILRIRWNAIRPGIDAAIDLFASHTPVDEAVSVTTDVSRELSGRELHETILALVGRGDLFDAVTLVKTHYGFNSTEARKFIDDLADKETADPDSNLE